MEKVKERTRKSWSAGDKIGIIRKHLLNVKLVDNCNSNYFRDSSSYWNF